MKSRICVIIIFLLAFLPVCRTQTVITADTVAGQWTAGGSPYVITGNITIPKDTFLVIEKGSEIHFSGNYALHVEGRLVAKGTKRDRIDFVFVNQNDLSDQSLLSDDQPSEIKGWKGIRFSDLRQAKDTSVLVWCNIHDVNALTGSGYECAGGGISIRGSALVEIKNCTISENKAHVGAAIYCNGNNALIEGNMIENNESVSNGGALFFYDCHPVVKNNLIRMNSSPEFGGAIFCEKTGGTFINNTIIQNNARFGGAISLVKSNIRIMNNTIADNKADQNGGGIHCRQSSPYVKNSIVWGNTALDKGKQFYLYMLAYPEIVYSDIQGGLTAIEKFSDSLNTVTNYQYNLDEDPAFDKNDTSFYSLKELSACIDAGMNQDPVVSEGFDMRGNPRIVNQIIDMGAQEFMRTEDISEKETDDEELENNNSLFTIIYPNPSKGNFTVEINGLDEEVAFMGIVSVNGQELYNQSLYLSDDNFKQQVSLEFNPGLYFMELKNNEGQVIKKEKLIIE